jgi:hypothetical protein
VNRRRLTWKDIAGLFVGAIIYGLSDYQARRRQGNFGFGPEWRRSTVGQDEPVCLKN